MMSIRHLIMHTHRTATPIYRLMLPCDWNAFKHSGVYYGTEKESQNGVIHFSPLTEIDNSARHEFLATEALKLLVVNPSKLDGVVSWVQARNGVYFPQLTGFCRVHSVVQTIDYPNKR